MSEAAKAYFLSAIFFIFVILNVIWGGIFGIIGSAAGILSGVLLSYFYYAPRQIRRANIEHIKKFKEEKKAEEKEREKAEVEEAKVVARRVGELEKLKIARRKQRIESVKSLPRRVILKFSKRAKKKYGAKIEAKPVRVKEGLEKRGFFRKFGSAIIRSLKFIGLVIVRIFNLRIFKPFKFILQKVGSFFLGIGRKIAKLFNESIFPFFGRTYASIRKFVASKNFEIMAVVIFPFIIFVIFFVVIHNYTQIELSSINVPEILYAMMAMSIISGYAAALFFVVGLQISRKGFSSYTK